MLDAFRVYYWANASEHHISKDPDGHEKLFVTAEEAWQHVDELRDLRVSATVFGPHPQSCDVAEPRARKHHAAIAAKSFPSFT